MHIYVSLLKQMAPEHLLATSAKLCAEILAAACDGLLSVDDASGRAVLQVCTNILVLISCRCELKVFWIVSTRITEWDLSHGDEYI